MPFQARLYKNQSPQALSTIAVSPGDTFELILCGLTSLYQNAVLTFSCKPGSFKNNLTAIANDLPAFPSTSSLSITLPSSFINSQYTIDLVPTQTSALSLNTTYALELEFLLTTGEIESWQFVFKIGQDIVGNTTPGTAGVNNRRNLGSFSTAPSTAVQGDSYYNTSSSKYFERINGAWVEFVNNSQSLEFNVKDYGAVGNNSTDDTTAIQSALNACNTAGGGTVYFPKGIYIANPNTGLNVYSNTIIKGDGASTIKVKNATNLDGNLLRIENKTNVKIENIALDGNKTGQTGSTNYGLYLSDSLNCVVDDVTTFNFSGVGTQIYDCDDCVVTNSTSYSNGYHGYEIEQCRATVVTNNIAYSNTRHGFYLAPGEISGTGSKQCVISHNIARNNSQYGISVGISVIGSTYLTQGCIINSNQIYENSHYGISLYQQDQQIVQNNIIRNNGFSGIYLYQSRLNKIEGNYLQNNSASLNNGYDEIQIEGGNDGTGSQNNTIAYNTIITNNGSAKARYAIREAHASDNSNQIVYNSVFDSPATGRYLLNSKYIEYSGNYINTNTPLQTNSGAGQAVQSGFAGIDGEFGIMRVVNNKGNTPTQYVNIGTGNQEFFINGAKKLEINTSNISAENNQIKNLGTPTLSTDSATKGYVDTGLGTKQNTLVSGTNIKTVNSQSLLGSGDILISGATWGGITGTLASQTDLQTALNLKQNTITNSDSITQGSTNLFLTTAERTKLSNTTNTNTGDETTGSILNKIGNGTVINDNYIPNTVARDSEILTKTLDTTFVPTNSAIVLGNTILQSLEKAQGQINNKENTITAGTTSQYWRGDKTFQTLDKTAVGLANVDNTSDLNKPISTATQTGLDAKANIAGQVFTGNIQTPQINTSKQTLTPTGTTQSINWNNGSIIDLVLSSATGNVTLTLLNSQNASSYLIEVTNGATPRNLIFPTGTLQSNGGGNVYVGIANQKDVIAVLWDGTQFLISVSRNYA
jgi:parallel beta-helix repeat protein